MSMIHLNDIDLTKVAPAADASGEWQPPLEFLIVKLGRNNFTIGNKADYFDVLPEDLDTIYSEFKSRQRELPIDWDHGTMQKKIAVVGDAPASGWIRDLKKIPGQGLAAQVGEWTPKAVDRLKNREYKYFSPVLDINPETKRPVLLHSCALTNHPAVHGCPSLLAANDLATDDDRVVLLQTLIQETMKSQKSLNDILFDALNDYEVLASHDESLRPEMMAFNDSILADMFDGASGSAEAITNVVDSFGDAGDETSDVSLVDEIEFAQASMNPLAYLTWLSKRKASASKPLHIKLLDAAISDAEKNKDTSGAPIMVSMSDITSAIGVRSDIPIAALRTELLALRGFKNQVINFMDTHKVSTLTSLSDSLEKYEKEILEKNADALLATLIEEGRMVPAQMNQMRTLALNDFDTFKRFAGTLPVMYADSFEDIQKPTVLNDSKKDFTIFTPEQLDVARGFGKTPEELFSK